MTKQSTDHDILIRIDERQVALVKQVETISKKLDCMVPDDEEYKQLQHKVENLWDSKNRVIGWMVGAGITGGGIATVLSGLAKDVLAFFK